MSKAPSSSCRVPGQQGAATGATAGEGAGAGAAPPNANALMQMLMGGMGGMGGAAPPRQLPNPMPASLLLLCLCSCCGVSLLQLVSPYCHRQLCFASCLTLWRCFASVCALGYMPKASDRKVSVRASIHSAWLSCCSCGKPRGSLCEPAHAAPGDGLL